MVMHFLWFAVFGLFFLLFHLPFLWSSQPLPSTSKDETPLATCVHQHFQSFTCVVGSTGDLHNLGMAKENAKHTTVVGDRHHSKGSYNSYRYTNKFKTSGKLPIFLEYSMRHTSNQQKKKTRKITTSKQLDLEALGFWPIMPKNAQNPPWTLHRCVDQNPRVCSRAAVAAARNRGATCHGHIWLEALYICGPNSSLPRGQILYPMESPSPQQVHRRVHALVWVLLQWRGGVIWYGDGDGFRNAIAGSSSHHRPRQSCVSCRSWPRKLQSPGPAPGQFPQVKNCSILLD